MFGGREEEGKGGMHMWNIFIWVWSLRMSLKGVEHAYVKYFKINVNLSIKSTELTINAASRDIVNLLNSLVQSYAKWWFWHEIFFLLQSVWISAYCLEFNLVKWYLTKLTAMSLACVFLVSGQMFKCRLTWFVKASFQCVCIYVFQQRFCVFEQLVLLGFSQFYHSWFSSSSHFGSGNGLFAFRAPPPPSLSFSLHWLLSVLTGAWNGGSWLGCGDLPAMGAVFYLGAGWPQWKPLDIPGTHLPLKRGSGLNKDT